MVSVLSFVQSFDPSKFPYLQKADFGVGWMGGDLPWIPTALSTIRLATSPRLAAIRVNFIHPSTVNGSVRGLVEVLGNDL